LPQDGTFESYALAIESAAEKLDYKRYAETLFEYIFIGGLLGE
jgi:hypothetical protein